MTLTPTTPYWALAIALTLMGTGSGFFWPANTSTTMSAAPSNRLGIASATLNTLRNVGMIFSFAIALAVTAASMPPAVEAAVFLGTVGHLDPTISLAFTDGMRHAFLASGFICIFAIFCSIVRGRKVAKSAPGAPGLEQAIAEPSIVEVNAAGD